MEGQHMYLLVALCFTTLIISHCEDATPSFPHVDSTGDTKVKDDNFSGLHGQVTEAKNQKTKSVEENAGHSAFKVETKCLEGWTEWNGVCYFIDIHTKRTWPQAHADCIRRSQGRGDLVSIHSKEEHDFVLRLGKDLLVWIGLYLDSETHAEKNFEWSDNTPKDYTNWHTDQPDNWEQSERCVEVDDIGHKKWNDVPCYSRYQYICKAPRITVYSGLVEAR